MVYTIAFRMSDDAWICVADSTSTLDGDIGQRWSSKYQRTRGFHHRHVASLSFPATWSSRKRSAATDQCASVYASHELEHCQVEKQRTSWALRAPLSPCHFETPHQSPPRLFIFCKDLCKSGCEQSVRVVHARTHTHNYLVHTYLCTIWKLLTYSCFGLRAWNECLDFRRKRQFVFYRRDLIGVMWGYRAMQFYQQSLFSSSIHAFVSTYHRHTVRR